MRVWSAVVGAAWLFGAAAAFPSTTTRVMPTASLETYYRAERAAGAERSEALSRAILWTADHRTASQRDALWTLAAQADPALADPHLRRASTALRHADVATALAAFGDAWQAMRLDAHEEARWLRQLVHALDVLLTATFVTLCVLFTLRGLRLVRHAVGAALGSRAAALVCLGVPILCAAMVAPVLAAVVAAAGSAPFLRRRECRTLAIVCALLGAVQLGAGFAARHAVLLDPRTTTFKIAHLNDAGRDAALERQVAAVVPRPAEVELVLGLQARRRGDVAAAQERFVAALRADTTCAPAYVNLANLFFRSGAYERAATGYRAAQSLDPIQPLAYANLAQTYIRLTKYSESDGELRAAAAHGMATVTRRRALWRDDAQPVFDATLPPRTLLRLANRELAATPGLRGAVLESWRADAWRPLPSAVAALLLLVTAALLAAAPRLVRIARECPECGTVICAHCVAMAPMDDRCNACQVARPKPRVPGVDIVTPEKRRRLSLSAGRWIAPLFPGAADLVRGAPVAAAAVMLAAWSAIVAVSATIDAARLRADPWYTSFDPRVLQVASVMIGLLWMPGLLRLRRRESDTRVAVRRAPAPGA